MSLPRVLPSPQPDASLEPACARTARAHFDLAAETFREHEAACDICRYDARVNAGMDCDMGKALANAWAVTHKRLLAARKRAT